MSNNILIGIYISYEFFLVRIEVICFKSWFPNYGSNLI